MNNPLVSVIIPTKNSAKTLEACLKSVKEQSYKNIEIIVIDQESSDNTKEIVLKFGIIFAQISPSAFYTPPTKSRNKGAELSKGEILYHLDSDMILTPELIREAVDLFLNERSLGALIVHEQDLPKGFWSKAKALERKCYWGNQNIESARIVKRTIFEKVEGYDEDISSGEDFDIQRRYEKITKIDFCRNVVFHDLGQLNFFRLIKKKYSYGKTARKYFLKHSESGRSLLKEQFKCFLNNYNLFLVSPLIGFGTIILKITEFGFGGLGYLMGKLEQ